MITPLPPPSLLPSLLYSGSDGSGVERCVGVQVVQSELESDPEGEVFPRGHEL
jgi:hypothetical protein